MAEYASASQFKFQSFESVQDVLHATMQNHVNIHSLNYKEVLIIPHFNGEQNTGLWKVNVLTNEWLQWHTYPSHITCRYITSSLNKDKTKVYIFGDPGRVITIDLKTGHFAVSAKRYHDGAHARSLCIDDVFHVFGGWNRNDNYHFIWNEVRQTLDKRHRFEQIERSMSRSSVLYQASKQTVIIIPRRFEGHIFLYSLQTEQCSKVSIQLLAEEQFKGGLVKAVLCQNENTVIYHLWSVNKAYFGVLDLKTFVFEIKRRDVLDIQMWCVRQDQYSTTRIVEGYLRKRVTVQMAFPPPEIVGLIGLFYFVEYMEVITTANTHMSLSVDEILSEPNST